VIHAIVDGVKAICRKTFQFISDLYDAVKGLWHALEVTIERLINFVGLLFDFGKISKIKEEIHS